MISWVHVDSGGASGNTTQPRVYGDGDTSGNWTGVVMDVNSETETCFHYLPLIAKSAGRIMTFSVMNNTEGIAVAITTLNATQRIRFNGADTGSTSTSSNNVSITLICDGTRWEVLFADAGWA